jgi:hypothetical protein
MQGFVILHDEREPRMRSRLTLALLALSLPAADLAAQRIRIPLIGRGGPTPEVPVDKPPLAPGITEAMAYNRYRLSRFSVEQYPMLTYLQTTGFIAEGIPTSNVTLGDGTHIGFRVAPSLSLTLDMTSSVYGGPFSMGSADVGFRLKPWTSPRFTPFADARMSWAYTTPGTGFGSAAVPTIFFARSMYGDFTSGSGNGVFFGLGVETRVTPQLSMTTALLTTRYSMEARDMGTRREWEYTADATRLTVGLKYNHGRWLDAR